MAKKNQELNRREKSILHFIEKQIMTQGYPPSVREIGKAVGLNSTATVHSYLRKLEDLEIIEWIGTSNHDPKKKFILKK